MLKWGVASCGKISHDFVTALQTVLPESDHNIIAVAARSENDAKNFAEEHNIKKFYTGYLALAKDEEIDVVYIGNINTQHFPTAKLMLEHGKHVLMEKPFAMNEKQARKLFEIAEGKNLFIMEGNWSRFFPAYKEIRKIIQNGEIGDVLFASVNFGNSLQHVERITLQELGGGVTLDMGIYILQFQQFVFKNVKPLKIAATGHKNFKNTDETISVILTYPDGKMATVSVSARVPLPNEALIVGTKGTLRLPEFWCPTKLVTSKGVLEFKLPANIGRFNYLNSAGLAYEAEEVRQCILNGYVESPNMTHEETIELARIMDFIRAEVGVEYHEDFQEF